MSGGGGFLAPDIVGRSDTLDGVPRWGRFVAYGLAGWGSEIAATGLRSPLRDRNWRLTGTTYLWMFPIYGAGGLVAEPAHQATKAAGWPWWARGLIWTAGIYAVEAASGAAIEKVTGEIPWDYRRPRGSRPQPVTWRGLVRPAYAPVWFGVGLGLEALHDLLDRVDVQ